MKFSVKLDDNVVPMGNHSEAREAALQDMMEEVYTVEGNYLILLSDEETDVTKGVILTRDMEKPELVIH